MNTERKERRKVGRIFFPDKDGVAGIFDLPDSHNESITAKIMDLCEDGIGLGLSQDDEGGKLFEGDRLILTEIVGTEDLHFLLNMTLEIRWIVNVKYFTVGCEYVDLSQAVRAQIRQCMNSWGKD